MSIWYVKEAGDIGFFKRIFRIIDIKQLDTRFIVTLPINKDINRNSKKYQEQIAKKLIKKMYDKDSINLVISKNINNSFFTEALSSYNCKILDGRISLKFLSMQVIEYISKMSNKQIKELDVAIISNDTSENALNLIIEIAKNVKLLSIVTNDIDKFKKLENYLIDNYGIIVRTTSNKKKALIKSNIIYNFDSDEKTLNQFTIPKRAVIVNVPEKVQIKSKKFDGINCNSYNAKLSKKYKEWFEKNNLLNYFDSSVLLDSVIYSKTSYDAIKSELNGACICNLTGINGVISEKEFSNFFD